MNAISCQGFFRESFFRRLSLQWIFALMIAGCSSPEMLVRQAALPGGAIVSEYDLALHMPSVHGFDPVDLSSVVANEQRPLKIDSLLILLDLEGLKGKHYRSIPADVYGREIVRRWHQTMPVDAKLLGNVWVTGISLSRSAPLLEAPPHYDTRRFESTLDQGVGANTLDGTSLALAIDQLAVESVQHTGRMAIVLVTSWERIDTATENAVIRLRQRHEAVQGVSVSGLGGRLWSGRVQSGQCLYAIGVGNTHSRERLYTPESCGSYVAGDAVMQPSEMASFVLDVLYGPPKDSDGDGVPNHLDLCGQTPTGRMVTSLGCLRFPLVVERDGGNL